MREEALQRIAENKRTKAKVLYLSALGLEELPMELAELIWLEELDLSFNPITHLPTHPPSKSDNFIGDSPLAPLTGLRSLNLWDTQVADISPLRGMAQLQDLDLDGTQVADISPLRGMAQLQWLYLSGTQVADISPLRGMAQLQWLYLNGTRVADISPLRGMTKLKELGLYGTQVADISPLMGMAQLQWLNLSGTKVADISPLREIIEAGRPVQLGRFNGSYSIFLQDCPLTNPPVEIARQGNEAILSYWRKRDLKPKGFLPFCVRLFSNAQLPESFLQENLAEWKTLHLVIYEDPAFPNRQALLDLFARIGIKEPQADFLGLLQNEPPSGLEAIAVPVAIRSDGTEVEMKDFKRQALTGFQEALMPLTSQKEAFDVDPAKWRIVVEGESHLISIGLMGKLQESLLVLLSEFYRSIGDGQMPELMIGPPERGSSTSEIIAQKLPDAIAWMVANGAWIATLDIFLRYSKALLKHGWTLSKKGVNAAKKLWKRSPSALPTGDRDGALSAENQALIQKILNFLEAAATVVQHSSGDFVLKQSGDEKLRIKREDLVAVQAIIDALSIRVEGQIGALLWYKGLHGNPPNPDLGEFIVAGRLTKGIVADSVYDLSNLPVMKSLRANLDKVFHRDPDLEVFLESHVVVKDIEEVGGV